MGERFVNDLMVGEGRIPHNQPMIFSADRTTDLGIELAAPVVNRIGSERTSQFTGHMAKVTVEASED